jgi:hypothetical protein
MKKFILFSILISFGAFGAGTVSTKSQTASSPTTAARIETYNSAMTTTGDQKVLLEDPNNWLINPSFEHSTVATGWTLGSGSVGAVETTIIHPGSGKQALKVTMTSVNGASLSQSVTPSGSMVGTNVGRGIWVYATANNLRVCPLNAGSIVGSCATVPNDSTWHFYSLIVAGPSSGSVGLGVSTTSSTSGVYYVDDGVMGDAIKLNLMSQGTPPNRYTVSVSATDVESNFTPSGSNWVSCVDGGTGIKTCTFANLTLSSTPNLGCTVTNDNRGMCSITSKSTTGFTVNTINEGNPGAFADFQVDIWMEKTGSDYVQNAITANNYNFGWTNITSSFATPQGLGTIASGFFEAKRDGGDLLIRGRGVTGTVTASEIRFTLPFGLTSLSAFPAGNTTQTCGRIMRNTTSVGAANITCLIDQNVNYFRVGIGDGGSATIMSPAAGSTAFNTGETFSLDVLRIPIQGWTETHNAPQLVGSVTSDSPSSLRIGAFLVSTTGVYTQLMGDPMLSGNCTVSGGSSNSYSCPFNFTASGGGACTGNSTAGGVKVVENVTVNTTSLTYTGADHAGTGQPVAMMWICLIPR